MQAASETYCIARHLFPNRFVLPLLSVTDHQTVLTEQNITKALIAIQSAVPPNCLDGAVDAVCRLLGPEGLYAVFVGHLELPSEWISVT